jgi:hypothetical protein
MTLANTVVHINSSSRGRAVVLNTHDAVVGGCGELAAVSRAAVACINYFQVTSSAKKNYCPEKRNLAKDCLNV